MFLLPGQVFAAAKELDVIANVRIVGTSGREKIVGTRRSTVKKGQFLLYVGYFNSLDSHAPYDVFVTNGMIIGKWNPMWHKNFRDNLFYEILI